MPVKMLPEVEPDSHRLAELDEELKPRDERVNWIEFAILRAYKQLYREKSKPGWRRLQRWAWAIRIKHGESRRQGRSK